MYYWMRDTDFSTWTTQELQELVADITDMMNLAVTPPWNQVALRDHCREMRVYALDALQSRG